MASITLHSILKSINVDTKINICDSYCPFLGLAALQNSPVETIFEDEESQYSIRTVCEDYEDYVVIGKS